MVALLMRLVQGPGCSRLAGGRKPRRHAGGAAPPTKASWKCRIPFTRLLDTRGNTVTFPLPNPTADQNGPFITDKVGDTEAYDQIKVDAILNQIDGLNSAGTTHVGVPAIFGMNFQTVSVAQKLVDPQLSCVRSNNATGCDPSYIPGGYEPGTLQFTPQLSGAISF